MVTCPPFPVRGFEALIVEVSWHVHRTVRSHLHAPRPIVTRLHLPVGKLICDELDYEYVNSPLPTRDWPEDVRDWIAAGPTLFARHKSPQGNFDIIFIRLKRGGRPDFPLSLAVERQIVGELLDDHPYALFLFADPDGHYWHFVNVRPDAAQTSRRVFVV